MANKMAKPKRVIFIPPDVNYWQQKEIETNSLGFGRKIKNEDEYSGPMTSAFRNTMKEIFGSTDPIITKKEPGFENDATSVQGGDVASDETIPTPILHINKSEPRGKMSVVNKSQIAKKTKSELAEYVPPAIDTPLSSWLVAPKK